MIQSITGFAPARSKLGDFLRTAEIRSVNSRALDIKLKLPEWIDGLEAASRDILQKNVSRGSISINFKMLNKNKASKKKSLDLTALEKTLVVLKFVEDKASESEINLAPSKASDLLQNDYWVYDNELMPDDIASLKSQIISALEKLVSEFCTTKRAEGGELKKVLTNHLADLEQLFQPAVDLLPTRHKQKADNLKAQLSKLSQDVGAIDPEWVAQELAIMVVRSNVMEEINRLKLHFVSTREMLINEGIIGRKMDFLMQEFNRKANTLCSKSQYADLTAICLEIKVLIDQMRDQIQNVE